MNLAPNLKQRWHSLPPLGWLLLLTFACLAPFLVKAFHIDDTLFLRAAEQIRRHPSDFYGFSINWSGTDRPMTANFDNPPLACYYLALVSALAGWSEPALHLAFLLPALAAAWGIFSLARRYCARPLQAATVAVLTPVFLISGTTVMCDMLLLAFWVWAMVFFEKGRQKNAPVCFIASGLLAGLAFLSKFTGLAVIPLLGIYGLWSQFRGQPGRPYLQRATAQPDAEHGELQTTAPYAAAWWMIVPLLVLVFAAGYEAITFRLYGKGLLLAAMRESSAIREDGSWLGREIVGLSFLGGCLLPVLFYAPALWSRRSLLWGVILLVPFGLFCSFLEPFNHFVWHGQGHPDWVLLLQTLLFIAGGVQVLLLAASEAWQRRDSVSLFLFLWSAGIFLFATVFNWTCNGRSFLPMLPAVAILVARRLERRVPLCPKERLSWRLHWPAVAAAAVSLLLAKADCDLAGTGRAAARELCAKYAGAGRRLWFEGHWGFQHYMEQGGARPLELDLSQVQPGELIVIPSEAFNIVDVPSNLVRVIDMLSYPSKRPYATMSTSAGAGFYASVAGPFPFSAGFVNPECYYVFEVVQTLAAATQAPGGISLTGALAEQYSLERQALGWQRALRDNPDDVEAHCQLGRFLASRSRTAAALKHFSEVVRLRPNDGPAQLELALILDRQRNATAASKHFPDARTNDGN